MRAKKAKKRRKLAKQMASLYASAEVSSYEEAHAYWKKKLKKATDEQIAELVKYIQKSWKQGLKHYGEIK